MRERLQVGTDMRSTRGILDSFLALPHLHPSLGALMLGGNVSKTSFLGHPKLSLTPGACSQIQDLISSLTLSYTTHTSPQERSSHEKLHKTSDIIFHGYLPSRT